MSRPILTMTTAIRPDCFVVLRSKEDPTAIRLFTGYYGGYITPDSWRLSSAISTSSYNADTQVAELQTHTGTKYAVRFDGGQYRMSGLMSAIYDNLEQFYDVLTSEDAINALSTGNTHDD